MRATTTAVILPALALILSACARAATEPSQLVQAAAAAPDGYAALLATYVKPDGVDYAAWHSNEEDLRALREVVEFYQTTRAPADNTTSLAWHLNAYNASTLHNILNKYPTPGPLFLDPLFFHGKRIIISGHRTSLDALEQKVIRPAFNEPRIHFAINCASESCPPLLDRPFQPQTLDRDLDQLTRAFLNHNPHGVVIKQPATGDEPATVGLSKIFEWYAGDFGGSGQLINYINPFRDQPLPTDATVEIMDYSWNLNRTSLDRTPAPAPGQ